MIQYVKGDATNPIGDGMKLLPHICTTAGGWGRGYVLALSKKWSDPEFMYRSWFKKGENPAKGTRQFELGAVQYIPVEKNICVVNMISQEGYSRPGLPAIRYEALEQCLEKLVDVALKNKASIHMPRIGAGLAGGDWQEIERIINRTLCASNINVFVYDLE